MPLKNVVGGSQGYLGPTKGKVKGTDNLLNAADTFQPIDRRRRWRRSSRRCSDGVVAVAAVAADAAASSAAAAEQLIRFQGFFFDVLQLFLWPRF